LINTDTLALPSLLLLFVGGVTLILPTFAVVGWGAHNLAAATLFVHATLLVWRGWRNDLVEARRRLQGGVLAAAVLYGMAVVGVQLWELAQGPADSLSPFAAIALCLLAVAALLAFAQPNQDLFDPLEERATHVPQALADLSADALARRLDALMRNERVYRDKGLSIGALASRLGVPEYRLRRLINQRLDVEAMKVVHSRRD
jgi:hypothetical protein